MDDAEFPLRHGASVKISPGEDAKLQSTIFSYVRSHPQSKAIPNSKDYSISLFQHVRQIFSLSSVRWALALFFALFLSTGGIAYAAGSALPGDPLYSFKLNVNERIAGVLQTNAKAKSQFQATLAIHRLEETEKLVAKGKLNEDKKTAILENFSLHIAKLKKQIVLLEKAGNEQDAADISSSFEASLRGHEAVLALLPKSGDMQNAQLQLVLRQIHQVSLETQQIRKISEKNTQSQPDQKTIAQESISAAMRAIDELGKRLQEDSATTTAARRHFLAAASMLAKARESLNAQAYADAFLQAKAAQRKVSTLNILLDASTQGDIHLTPDTESGDVSSDLPSSASSAADASHSSEAERNRPKVMHLLQKQAL